MPNEIEIKRDQVVVTDDAVEITSSELTDLLTKDKEEAIDLLKGRVSEFNVDDLTFDADGKITINNPDFQRAMSLKIERDLESDGNYICNNGCD